MHGHVEPPKQTVAPKSKNRQRTDIDLANPISIPTSKNIGITNYLDRSRTCQYNATLAIAAHRVLCSHIHILHVIIRILLIPNILVKLGTLIQMSIGSAKKKRSSNVHILQL